MCDYSILMINSRDCNCTHTHELYCEYQKRNERKRR